MKLLISKNSRRGSVKQFGIVLWVKNYTPRPKVEYVVVRLHENDSTQIGSEIDSWASGDYYDNLEDAFSRYGLLG